MMTKEQIKEIVENKIKQDEYLEKPGEHKGISLSTNFDMLEIDDPVSTDKGYVVNYKYITYILNEFSIFPGNSPLEYLNEMTITINEEGKIMEESEKISTCIGGGNLFNMELF